MLHRQSWYAGGVYFCGIAIVVVVALVGVGYGRRRFTLVRSRCSWWWRLGRAGTRIVRTCTARRRLVGGNPYAIFMPQAHGSQCHGHDLTTGTHKDGRRKAKGELQGLLVIAKDLVHLVDQVLHRCRVQ